MLFSLLTSPSLLHICQLVGAVSRHQYPADVFYQSRLAFGNDADERYDSGLFAPIETLDALSVSDYTTLAHPAFPKYDVRIKQSDFCDGGVR